MKPTAPAQLAAAAVAAVLMGSASAQPAVDFKAAKIEILPVQGNVYMLAGPAGNSTVQEIGRAHV